MKLKIAAEDLLKGQLHNPGWKKGEIVWAEAKPAKANPNKSPSINYNYVVQYTENGQNWEIKSQFNSQALGFTRPFLAALQGLTEKQFIDKLAADKKEVDFEWESIKGHKLQFRIENKPREDNGQLTSKITEFLPYDYAVPF